LIISFRRFTPGLATPAQDLVSQGDGLGVGFDLAVRLSPGEGLGAFAAGAAVGVCDAVMFAPAGPEDADNGFG